MITNLFLLKSSIKKIEMPRTILNTNEIRKNKSNERDSIKKFFQRIKLLNDKNALPPMISVPAPIFKYMARGKYGEQIKRVDFSFSDQSATVTFPYTADAGAGSGPFNGFNIDNAGKAVQSINLVQQGTSVAQRIGNKIALRSIKLAIYLAELVRLVPQAQANPFYGRVILVYDRQPGGTYPSFFQMFNGYFPDGATLTNEIGSGLDVNNLQRYTVIMDKKCLFPPNLPARDGSSFTGYVGSTIPEPHFMINDFVPLHDLESMFNSNTTFGLPQITTGALYLVVTADEDHASSPWYMQGVIRLTFRDI